ncbi:MAG: hypothetical protein P8171_07640 [Candidatus Thiodiazotropha sp.]
MKRKFIIPTLATLLSVGPVYLSAADTRDVIEDGKAFGAEVNATVPNAANLSSESVPGYETSSPPESTYYDRPASVGDAANQAAASNEAAQNVNEGFATRPMFTIDTETDPMFQRKEQVEANAASIAGALEGEYEDCEPVVLQTPGPTITETCTESKSLETTRCKRTNDCTVTGKTMRCEPKHFPCTPTATSCCSFDIRCRGDGAVTVTYQDCCGHTYTSTAHDIDDFYMPGLQYNWNDQSRLVCAANGACTVDFTDYRCDDPTQVLGFHPDVNKFSFDMEPTVECVLMNNCAGLEARAR